MRQNFTTTISYFIYQGMAILMHPANNFLNKASAKYAKTVSAKGTKAIAPQKVQILHSELLFKY